MTATPVKLLLVNCLNTDEGLRYVEDAGEHLGILYLASSLRRYFSSDVLDIRVEYHLSPRLLDDYKPNVVGLSSVSQNYCAAIRYASMAKSRGAAVLVGGVHISTLPRTLDKNMDAGVINEGEETIVELMRLFFSEGRFPPEKLKEIKGLVFYENGSIAMTPPRPPVENLDDLPIPARELFDHPKRGVFTSRGCPYECSFCFSKSFWGRPRFFSAEYVVKEMLHIYEKYRVSKINIYDDLFTANPTRFRRIAELVRAEGLHKKVSFSCAVRPNMITDETARILKSMNVDNVFLGLESGNPRVLAYLKKRACSVENNYESVRILKKHGIITNGGFIIGSPDETADEINDTLDFIRRSKIDFFSPLILTPYPGTDVWEYAKKRGLVSDDMDWGVLRLEFHEVRDRAVVLSEKLSREELWRLYKKFLCEQKKRLVITGVKHPLLAIREIRRALKYQFHYAATLFAQKADSVRGHRIAS